MGIDRRHTSVYYRHMTNKRSAPPAKTTKVPASLWLDEDVYNEAALVAERIFGRDRSFNVYVTRLIERDLARRNRKAAAVQPQEAQA